jgi:hypothetical protein
MEGAGSVDGGYAEVAEGAEGAEKRSGEDGKTSPSVTLRVTPPPEARGRRGGIGGI